MRSERRNHFKHCFDFEKQSNVISRIIFGSVGRKGNQSEFKAKDNQLSLTDYNSEICPFTQRFKNIHREICN